jgi:hypothetical protein
MPARLRESRLHCAFLVEEVRVAFEVLLLHGFDHVADRGRLLLDFDLELFQVVEDAFEAAAASKRVYPSSTLIFII